MTPLEELKRLDQQIDQVNELAGLQPLFARLEELTKQFSTDFEVQLVAHDVKQHILSRGSRIRQSLPPVAAPIRAVPPVVQPPPPPLFEPPETTPLVAPAPPGGQSVPPVEKSTTRKRPVWAFVAGVLLALIAAVVLINVARVRNQAIAAATPMDVRITTEPAGASIRVNGKESCVSDCIAKVLPGKHEVTAVVEGYEPASSPLTVLPSQAGAVHLVLQPQPQTLRVFADLADGEVLLDGQKAGVLQDGQFLLERVEPGKHVVAVTGGGSSASFSFQTAVASMPVVQGAIETKQLLAVLVSSFGTNGRLVSSAGPLPLTVNGKEENAASPDGVDLTGFQPGTQEFLLGEGKQLRTLSETFGPAPTLTAFLKSDQNIGTLVVAAGQDDVRVYINNKEHSRRTQKGLARIQTFGNVSVRVHKNGFEDPPAQTATVEKGGETRLSFTLRPVPEFSFLLITGGTPGTEVALDQRALGTVGGDGVFRNQSIPPGDHVLDLRRDQFESKRFQRSFRLGQTVTIAASEAALAAIVVAPPPLAPPPPPKVVEPPPVKITPPPVRVGSIADFDNPGAWRQEDGIWRHRGAAALTYKISPNGIFTFSIYMLKAGSLLGGGRVRWFVNYLDERNYGLFELDAESFYGRTVVNGKTTNRVQIKHKQNKDMRVWNIQLDVDSKRAIHRIQDETDQWMYLDTWSDPARDLTQGKFGILVTGNDEVGVSNFTYTSR
ncbi:MAG: PEGA domain-containing protein [Acidobacteriota bacterium]